MRGGPHNAGRGDRHAPGIAHPVLIAGLSQPYRPRPAEPAPCRILRPRGPGEPQRDSEGSATPGGTGPQKGVSPQPPSSPPTPCPPYLGAEPPFGGAGLSFFLGGDPGGRSPLGGRVPGLSPLVAQGWGGDNSGEPPPGAPQPAPQAGPLMNSAISAATGEDRDFIKEERRGAKPRNASPHTQCPPSLTGAPKPHWGGNWGRSPGEPPWGIQPPRAQGTPRGHG